MKNADVTLPRNRDKRKSLSELLTLPYQTKQFGFVPFDPDQTEFFLVMFFFLKLHVDCMKLLKILNG